MLVLGPSDKNRWCTCTWTVTTNARVLCRLQIRAIRAINNAREIVLTIGTPVWETVRNRVTDISRETQSRWCGRVVREILVLRSCRVYTLGSHATAPSQHKRKITEGQREAKIDYSRTDFSIISALILACEK